MAAHAYIPRINSGGNFCGHDPLRPVFELAKPAKVGVGGIPRILTLCMERLTTYYYRPTKVIPSLNLANGSNRQQRSERREACICLLAALLKRVDLTSLRVGIPTKTGFLNYTIDYIAMDTGMTLKRVERALHDLKAAGLVTVAQPRQLQTNGTWKGLAAVKALSKHLFGIFGLGSMLKKERDKASKRLQKKHQDEKQNPPTRTERARLNLFLGALTDNLNLGKKGPPKPKTKGPPTPEKDGFENRKKLMLLAASIKQIHMDWDRDKCYEEAQKQLPRG